MHIYLPIAEMPVNILMLIALGVSAGLLSGMFGVGGGFIVTPFLIFMGIPAAIAVSTSSNQIIASSFSGFLAHVKRGNVDLKMGMALLLGGVFGSSCGIWIFAELKARGNIDLIISVIYFFFLAIVGIIMARESYMKIKNIKPKESRNLFDYDKLPLKIFFPHSNIEISILLPVGIGFIAGIMVSLLGVGGGLIMIPAMIYILGMPTSIVVGTSLFQIIFITSFTTLIYAATTNTVDIMLAIFLILGSVAGAQFGTKIGSKFPAEKLRMVLSVMILLIAFRLGIGLFIRPDEIYEIIAL